MQGLRGQAGDCGRKGIPGNACHMSDDVECEDVVWDGEPGGPGYPGRDGTPGLPGAPVSNIDLNRIKLQT